MDKKKIEAIELKRLEKNKTLKRFVRVHNICLESAKNLKQINDENKISGEIFKRFRIGFGLVDRFRKMRNANSSYGKLVYILISKLSSEGPIKKFNRFRKKEKSYWQQLKSEKPEIKKYSFQSSREGALYLEDQLMLFFIDKLVKDYSYQEKDKMVIELINEIYSQDELEKNRILDLYKTGKLGNSISKIILQTIRNSVGKGLFMNSAVKFTNVVLRFVIGKGMTFGENAVFRQFVAKWLGGLETGYGLVFAILTLIPDIAAFINKRDYKGLTNTTMALYLLRNFTNPKQVI